MKLSAPLQGVIANGLYDPGSPSLIAEQFVVQYQHLKLSGTNRYTMAGTGKIVLTDLHANDAVIVGSPKRPVGDFLLPTNYFYDVIQRLSLSFRATLQGTADLIITDDFTSRSRIVLAGRG